MERLLLKNGLIYRGFGFERCCVLIEGGRIAKIATEIDAEGVQTVDLAGLTMLPGLVDVHVHLREPGFEYKETIASGSAAAARAGYTAICPMPNLNPVPDSVEHLRVQMDAIERDARVRVLPYASITAGQKGEGELVDFEALAPYVIGFSDDGRGVQSDDLMREAMRRCAKTGRPIVAHCEVNDLLRGGYIHDGEYAREHGHKGICSESEWRQVERDINLVRATGCRYHVCHVSTKESVALVRRAKAEGLPVTCETAPHYLLLNETNLQNDGCYKMNPPLRGVDDQAALIEGAVDGTIDVIATDHAPHSAEEKSQGLEKSAFGIVGLETAFPLMFTNFVQKGVMSMERLVQMMCVNPRRIFGIPGGLNVGDVADIAVMNLSADYVINPKHFVSKGKSTPFAGYKVQGDCAMTIVDGRVVFRGFDVA